MSFGADPNAQMIQQKVQLEMIFSLIGTCFDDCITDLRTNSLSEGENACLRNCSMRNVSTQAMMSQVQQEMAQSGMGGQGGGF